MDLAAVEVLAQAALNTEGITTWVVKNVVPLIFLFIGIIIMTGAKKGRVNEGMTQGGILFLGLFVIACGIGAYAFAEDLNGLVFGGGATQ